MTSSAIQNNIIDPLFTVCTPTFYGNITVGPNWTVAGGGGVGYNNTYNTGTFVDQAAITKLSDRLKVIEDRLSIIDEVDPIKLEKYAALKLAYDNYKMLEKLCIDTENSNES